MKRIIWRRCDCIIINVITDCIAIEKYTDNIFGNHFGCGFDCTIASDICRSDFDFIRIFDCLPIRNTFIICHRKIVFIVSGRHGLCIDLVFEFCKHVCFQIPCGSMAHNVSHVEFLLEQFGAFAHLSCKSVKPSEHPTNKWCKVLRLTNSL